MASWPNPNALQPPSSGSHAVLGWALLGSVALHLGLLAWAPGPTASLERLLQDAALDVVLVNTRTQTAPQEPQALAQAHLSGGGHGEGSALATDPSAKAPQSQNGDRLHEVIEHVQHLEQQRTQLLSALRQELAELASQNGPNAADDALHQEAQKRRQWLSEQLARIEREQQDQRGPRRRYIGPNTQEVAYAVYYNRLRQRIESEGTRHFPEENGQKLYGELVMAITLDHQGRVRHTEVARSSGDARLDQHATRVVQQAAPYGDFSREMRQQADQLVVVTGFRFARDLNLHTRILAKPEGTP